MNDQPPAAFDKPALLVCLLLALLVALVFCQTGRYDFVNFDDDRYVYDNEHITPGFTLQNLAYYVIHWHSYTYHPITTYSHMLDCQLFGVEAGKHHGVNVLYHAATAIVLFLVLRQMTGRLWPSAIVAAIFAVHPLRVESVAWISERKDVLSGLFFVLTLGAYVRYVRNPQAASRYVVLCVLFALGLLAKPMLVTLPLLLLLLDHRPLGKCWQFVVEEGVPDDAGEAEQIVESVPTGDRETASETETLSATEQSDLATATLGATPASASESPRVRWHIPWHLFVEKVPLALLSLIACGITVHTQGRGGAIQSLETVSWVPRVANALVSYANYLGLFFWPRGLAVLYPHPLNNLSTHDAFAKAWLLALVSAAVFVSWRRMPYLLVGWLWYLGMLVPVIGLLQVGGQSMADRYTYLPQIGLAIALVWAATAACDWLRKTEFIPISTDTPISTDDGQSSGMNSASNGMNSVLRSAVPPIMAIAAIGVVVALAAAAWMQTTYWRNSETLWTRDLLYPNSVAYYDFGLALAQQGRHREAIEEFLQGVKLDPDDADTRNNLGQSYEAVGEPAAAFEQYQAVLAKDSKSVEANNNLSRLLRDRGNDREALQRLRTAYKAEPLNCGTCCRLADLLATSPEDALRDGAEALRLARKSVELSLSKDALALNSRAAAYAEQRDFAMAVKDAEAALRIAAADKNKGLVADIRARLELYRAGKPFRFKAGQANAKSEKQKTG